jgi:5-methylcytosine-specific restriction protein A
VRLCSEPGCYARVVTGLCPDHQRERRQARRPHDSRYTRLGNSRRWRRESARFLRQHPLCVECKAEGRIVPSTETHHAIPHRGDVVKFWDRSTWTPLCHECHSRATARETLHGGGPESPGPNDLTGAGRSSTELAAISRGSEPWV